MGVGGGVGFVEILEHLVLVNESLFLLLSEIFDLFDSVRVQLSLEFYFGKRCH